MRHPRFPAFALAFALASFPAAAKLTLMHGYADYTSALLWIQAEAPGAIEVSWRAEGETADRRIVREALPEDDFVVLVRLTGLSPGATATYRVRGDGDSREGAVRAQAHWLKPSDAAPLAIAIGSCFFLPDARPVFGGQDYGGGYEIFDAIADKHPDLMLWLGDNLYFETPDFYDPSSMRERYRRQRSFAPLAKLLTATAHVAIWDDHDFGPNDSDSSYAMKGTTLELFRRHWANPSYGLPDVAGTFGVARLGDVDLFLLDDRYYRSANKAADGPDKTMFGARQLEWLHNALLHSTARVKLVVNGTQMWNRANRFEGFNHYATEQKALAGWLVANRVNGVIFLSGDRHFGELLRLERPDAYPLYEFTSSPLTSKPIVKPEAGELANPDVVPGTLFGQRQFGMIRVSGPGNDRTIALESYDSSGKELWRRELRVRDLAFSRK